MKARILVGPDSKTIKFMEFEDMDAVSLSNCRVFKDPIYVYVYDEPDRVYATKAYAWRPVKLGDMVCLQDFEKKAKVITKVEYETFEVFQNDQNT